MSFFCFYFWLLSDNQHTLHCFKISWSIVVWNCWKSAISPPRSFPCQKYSIHANSLDLFVYDKFRDATFAPFSKKATFTRDLGFFLSLERNMHIWWLLKILQNFSWKIIVLPYLGIKIKSCVTFFNCKAKLDQTNRNYSKRNWLHFN